MLRHLGINEHVDIFDKLTIIKKGIMKLIYCRNCSDILNLKFREKKCGCGKSGGWFTDGQKAVYWGECIPIEVDNHSFLKAIRNQSKSGLRRRFKTFVISRKCDVFKKIEI